MKEQRIQCSKCKHIRELKHNFNRGFEISHCCVVLAKDCDGFVVEVTDKDMCEMFESMDGEDKENEESGGRK